MPNPVYRVYALPYLGKGEFIVLEADESAGSFLMLSPTIAVITNIEADHLDHYRGLVDRFNASISWRGNNAVN